MTRPTTACLDKGDRYTLFHNLDSDRSSLLDGETVLSCTGTHEEQVASRMRGLSTILKLQARPLEVPRLAQP